MNEKEVIQLAERQKNMNPDKTFHVVKIKSGCFEIIENINEDKKRVFDINKTKYEIIKTL